MMRATAPTPQRSAVERAGIAFVACDAAPVSSATAKAETTGAAPLVGGAAEHRRNAAAPSVSPTGAHRRTEHRRQVVIRGKRIKTVDMHAHCAVPGAMALMGSPLPGPQGLLLANLDDRLAAMDEQGIDVEALSINPFWYGAARDLAAEIIRTQNEALAEFCAAHAERFVAFASVALQHPDLAVEQLVHGVTALGLRGIAVGGSVNGEELSAARFHPIWAKAEELGVVVFLHPQGVPDLAERLRGNGGLDNAIGYPVETTIALSHLIFEGTLDRFPGLKICAAHGGGYLPSYAARSDAIGMVFPERVTPLGKRPTEYLKQLYVDSLVFTPEALRHLAAEIGPGRIVMGTDYPYPWTSTAVDHILATPDLSDEDRVAILGGTAARLLGLSRRKVRPPPLRATGS